MLTFRIFAFMALLAGVFRLLNIKVSDLFRDFINRPQSIKKQIDEATNRKKKRFIIRQIEEITEIMRLTDREDKIPVIFIACGVCAVIGTVIASMFNNIFMIPVLGIGMTFLPVWYIKLTASHFKKDISEELETALSIISTAYIRNEDIVTAVEENISYLNPPIKNVFADFLVQLKLIDSDIIKAIEKLKTQVENDVFQEWCDALMQCQYDRSLKSTLTPIVTKLSDIRVTTVMDEKELTFKYEASNLRRDCKYSYSDWYMPAKDRREFEAVYGMHRSFTPMDITRITYGKKVLYEKEV